MKELTTLSIKHMVCPRCITTVRSIAESLGLEVVSIVLGEFTVKGKISEKTMQVFKEQLEASGFSILVSREQKLINRIKTLIVERIHYQDEVPAVKLSSYLSDKLRHDYGYLSKIFSSVEAVTIERYQTAQRIERAKELLSYNEVSITEVAEWLGFSSLPHFSSHFKRETGLAPKEFKRVKHPERRSLDSI